MRKVLVLGGTGFIGRHFVETICTTPGVVVTLANRGSGSSMFPALENLLVDRDDFNSCRQAFAGREWDHVYDFSGITDHRIAHTIATLDTEHYTFLSSSAVDLAMPNDPYLAMAKDKLWCETRVSSGFPSLIVRAAFVVGKYDNTERFEQRFNDWVWKGTDELVRPAIEVEMLVSAMLTLGLSRHTGVVRAGYSL